MRHECRSPHVKTFRRSAVVRQLLTERHLSFWASQFSTHKPLSVPAATLTGWNRRILRSFELFNLSAPFLKLLKCAPARTSHAKVIVKQTRVLKFDFFLLRRFREVLTGDPNAPVGGLGPPIPPLYLCKTLESSVKKAVPTIPWFNPDFTATSQFPLFKSRREHTFLRYKIQIKRVR